MDVGAWLRGLGLGQYEQAFRDNDVDADLLARLTAEDLREIGVASVGHRRKLLDAIAALRGEVAHPPPAAGLSEPASGPPAAKPSPPGAERRQLTVMFVDLVGSTSLSQKLDPEEMREALQAYQNTVAGEIARFEGHVAKFMGDGVLAYFGWPRAHEDAAERAVRAALAVAAAVARLRAPDGAALACRIGIATGLVVVGDLVGEGAAQEEAVIGETPNVAARLQHVAGPGAVVIAEATRRLVGGLFNVQELEIPPLKGFSRAVRAFRILGEAAAKSRFEAARRARGVGPLVGREPELALLLDRWEQAKSGEGQVVLLVGEPGIGKSRLALALRERLQDEPTTGLRYYGSPYHTDTALWPMVEQLERATALASADTPAARLDRLEALLTRAGDDPRSAAAILARLLGLPTDGRYPPLDITPPMLRARTLELLVAQLVGLARQQPVLVTLEDAHWLDPTTRELFDRIVDRVQTLPVLLVVTARPEFVSRWPGYAHVTAISLNRLGARQTAAIAERICGGKPLPHEVMEQILARTDGVPLFAEEFTRAVLEAGVLRETADGYVLDGPLPALAIPATLHDSLMARLDRLKPVKELAQMAACIGREFTDELLAAVSGLPAAAVREGLGRLVAAELIHPRGSGNSRSATAMCYAFKHALVQELARGSLLKNRRRDLHRRIAAAIEADHPKAAEDEPEILAYHCAEAELWDRAAAYRLEAGRRAKARHATAEATAHLEACLELAGRHTDARPGGAIVRVRRDAWVLLGDLASLADDLDRANECYDRALEFAAGEAERRAVGNRYHQPRYASHAGGRIAFYEHGSGESAIVFVNPIVYGLATFQPILERLCQEFRVITVDCRGAGRSDPLVRPCGVAQHARDLRAVIEAADAAPAVGVGICSNQLLHLARERPGLFAKLMIVGMPTGSPGIGTTFFNPEYVRRRAEAYARQDVEALIQVHTEYVYTEEAAAELRRMAIERCRRLPRETLLSYFDPDPDLTVTPILEEIAVPTLVTHGREDRLNDFAAAEYIAARIPGARLYAFEGKGHNPMFSAAEEFCEVLKRFVRTGEIGSAPTRAAAHS